MIKTFNEARILVIQGERAERERVVTSLEKLNCSVIAAENPTMGLELNRERTPQIVLCDVRFPGMTGRELARVLCSENPNVLIAMLADNSEEQLIVESLRAGASDFLTKPFSADEVTNLVRRFLEGGDSRPKDDLIAHNICLGSIRLTLQSNPDSITPAVRYALDLVSGMVDVRELLRLELALHEALRNAYEHGNLGLSYEEKASLCEAQALERSLEERRASACEAGKVILFEARVEDNLFFCSVEDHGIGFDWQRRLQEMTANSLPARVNGRGLLLITHVFDKVVFNNSGNKVEMTKKLR